ncbi:dsRBD fold-containing protein [Mycobacterium sp. ITM-2016-00318]|uniref:dsRBD fold-containing protein n=1 Tax=Mycobacterium sp. ITM-2016-00318 TaxID=2099693 RepID=UPI0026B14B07|nr:dsRBD fold-containing protein [Mycobacterium sp. ITM-2016-00318]WNG91837.1 DUF1876 family protein [Mycobacterium sp. ITM-2016-00318]
MAASGGCQEKFRIRESGAFTGPKGAPYGGEAASMYDRVLDNDWHIDIKFDEDETHTHATVRARLGDDGEMTAIGDAFRNPTDISQPMIGEEIAAARALIALGTDLLHRAGARIEAVTRHPVHLIN